MRDVRGAYQPHRAAASFVHIIKEGRRAAAAVILHSRPLHTTTSEPARDIIIKMCCCHGQILNN